ncbi:putative membrane protein [Bacillus cereus NVH0597-99]|nr:putative membrane protein [Bacillus cereus NVH0597-99]
MIVLHITTILLSKKEGLNTYSNYIGIIITLVAFFPYIVIVLHMIAAIFLLLDAASTNTKKVYDS